MTCGESILPVFPPVFMGTSQLMLLPPVCMGVSIGPLDPVCWGAMPCEVPVWFGVTRERSRASRCLAFCSACRARSSAAAKDVLRCRRSFASLGGVSGGDGAGEVDVDVDVGTGGGLGTSGSLAKGAETLRVPFAPRGGGPRPGAALLPVSCGSKGTPGIGAALPKAVLGAGTGPFCSNWATFDLREPCGLAGIPGVGETARDWVAAPALRAAIRSLRLVG